MRNRTAEMVEALFTMNRVSTTTNYLKYAVTDLDFLNLQSFYFFSFDVYLVKSLSLSFLTFKHLTSCIVLLLLLVLLNVHYGVLLMPF